MSNTRFKIGIIVTVIFLAVITFFALTYWYQSRPANLHRLNWPAKDSLRHPFTLKKNHWIIINYWASWCKPCLQEMPALQALHNHQPNVTVIGISYDKSSATEIKKWSERLTLSYPMFSQFPLKLFGVEHIAALPATFIFTPKGLLGKILYGEQTEKSLQKVLEQLQFQPSHLK